jgi:hypothetical protein
MVSHAGVGLYAKRHTAPERPRRRACWHGELVVLERRDRGHKRTSASSSGRGLRDLSEAVSARAGGQPRARAALLGFRDSFFRAVLFVLVAVVDMADVADRTRVSTEQELLEQAVRRLQEVSAQLDADGLVVAGSQGQPRPNPLLAVEQKLRDEVNRRRQRVRDAQRYWGSR